MTDAPLAVLAGLGIGVALASAPGAVQAVLLAEALRGGVTRGLRALLGSSLTSAALLVALALGLSVVAPTGVVLRALRLLGGLYLVVLAIDGLRLAGQSPHAASAHGGLPAPVRGSLAVLLNPGGWLFFGAVASPLFSSASQLGGSLTALATAAALVVGLTLGDLGVVLIGGLGVRRGNAHVRTWVRRSLAGVLMVLGLWLLAIGVIS